MAACSIKVDKEYFYAHMLHINGRIEAAREFGKNITRILKV